MEEQNWSPLQQEILQEAEELIQAAPSLEQALDRLAQLLSARLRHVSWVGFYLLRDGRLELGPHSGRDHPPHPPALALDQGPQGLAATRAGTVLLPDLRRSARWLACPATALSEIVVPIRREGIVCGEIDVDSRKPSGFDRLDRRFLEALAELCGVHTTW